MMNPSPPELFAERPVRSEFTRGLSYRTRRIITVSVLTVLVVGGYYAMFGHARPPSEIPVITADGAWKQKPDQPGGMNIPHQDVEVYQELGTAKDGASSSPSVEHLLPPPETPKPASAMKPPVVPMDAAPPAMHTADNLASGAPEALTTPAPAPTPTIVTTVSPQAAAPKPVATVTPKAKPPAAKPAPTSITQLLQSTDASATPVVQLASSTDPVAAQSMVDKLQTQYAAFLGGVPLRVVKADLGAKGIFYRIQSQPVSADMANQICAALKNHNAGCLIVRH